jgi:hypothetical protein
MKPSSIKVWSPRLRTASERVRDASNRVATWTREAAASRAEKAHRSEPVNPVYILAAITLGIPTLLMIVMIGLNPGVQDGSFASILAFLGVSAFVIAAIFEIKRLADQPSETDHH